MEAKLFRPAIQRLSTLVLMALFCVGMAFLSIFFKTIEYEKGYQYKKEASQIMSELLDSLKKEASKIYQDQNAEQIKTNYPVPDSTLDPIDSGLVFFCEGTEGALPSKLSTLNPNFAALVVDLFLEAGLEEGDDIAVAFTGSLPGANVAVLSACEAMGINPIIITSVSASNWGACDYDRFSWLDMENELELFFNSDKYTSIAASIGKGGDCGNSLPNEIINKIDKKIKKRISGSGATLSNRDKDLEYHVDKRINKYWGHNNSDIKLYVNVGGGVASLGTYPGIKESTGFLSVDSLKTLKDKNQINEISVMSKMSLEHEVPAINIVNIEQLIENKLNLIDAGMNDDIEIDPEFIKVNEERLFFQEKYNLMIVIPSLVASLLLVLSIGVYSHFQIKKRMRSYEPDSIS